MQLYAGRLTKGFIKPVADLEVLDDTGSVVRMDANLGLGQVAAVSAVDLAAGRAVDHGVASVAVREITHVGALGFYTRRAAEHGCICFAFQNGSTFVPPFGPTEGV